MFYSLNTDDHVFEAHSDRPRDNFQRERNAQMAPRVETSPERNHRASLVGATQEENREERRRLRPCVKAHEGEGEDDDAGDDDDDLYATTKQHAP